MTDPDDDLLAAIAAETTLDAALIAGAHAAFDFSRLDAALLELVEASELVLRDGPASRFRFGTGTTAVTAVHDPTTGTLSVVADTTAADVTAEQPAGSFPLAGTGGRHHGTCPPGPTRVRVVAADGTVTITDWITL